MTGAPDTSLPQLARHDGVLTWSVPEGWRAISSAAVGGGLGPRRWVLNARVDATFARTDLEAWAAEVAAGVGLGGPGCALLTAADVSQVEQVHHDGVSAWATVGVTRPTWPHDPRAGRTHDARSPLSGQESPSAPGTVNIVVAVPVALSPSALVQAVGTVTEAKAQALVRSGVPGTGTASDAVVVLCPEDGRCTGGARPDGEGPATVPFAGVRSPWGRRIAHAVHDAVAAGLVAHPWDPGGAGSDPGHVW